MPETTTKIPITNEAHEKVGHLFALRLPWLVLGLLGGALLSLFVSRFEAVLSQNISLAFFIPAIVYLSDAVGTQTETLYIRALSRGRVNFTQTLLKEIFVGLALGLTLGSLLGAIAWLWQGNLKVALIVGLAMMVNLTMAPILALLTSQLFYKEHADPALGAGPTATIIQDALSLTVYLVTATFVLGTLV